MGKANLIAVACLLHLIYQRVSSFRCSRWSNKGIHINNVASVSRSSLLGASPTLATKSFHPVISLCDSSTESSTRLSMVTDQLSADCVGAILTAQDLGKKIGLSVIRNELVFVGVVAQPERAASTLAKYNMGYERVKETVITQVGKTSFVSELGASGPESDRTTTDDNNNDNPVLPFSPASKLLLDQALVISQSLQSPLVRSEHVLLALMGYNFGRPIEAAPALTVLSNMPGIKGLDGRAFSCFQFCEQLILDLEFQPDNIENGNNINYNRGTRDAVLINRGGLGFGTSTISAIGVDLTQLALEGKLDNVYGRDKEIRSALRTLGRRRKNNPCLIGEPGVGKTAVAEAIAQVLASAIAGARDDSQAKFSFPIKNPFAARDSDLNKKDETNQTSDIVYNLPPCPPSLAGARLISIELASLVAGTANRGDFEKKVQNLIKEASTSNVILFIDEIHNLLGTGGGGDGAMNAANLLKPALARGELRILGATTTPEYRRYIERDGALERRFQPLTIKEPTIDETIDILATIMPRYEEFHDVEYTSNALVAAAKLSDRYVSDRFLPDKAIDLLDEAGSMIKMREAEENFYVTEDAVAEVISEMSGIPIGRLDTGEKQRLQNLEDDIQRRIKGQNQAVKAVAKAIRRARSGMRDTRRPISSFLFVGPTGVGKTELCKSLAETYFGQEKDMIRIDMSEYMDRFSVSRLIGAPPGYVGYDEGGQLTEAVRRSPHSVVLFDELEKAHEDVLNILLQIMDEGKLTDGKGRSVNFKNTIFVMTSNIGSRGILTKSRESSGGDETSSEASEFVQQELEQAMKPELLNRIDEIIVFNPLSYDNVKEIAQNMLESIVKRASEEQGIQISISDSVAEMVTREGFVSEFGARPIRRAVKRYLEDTLAEAIIQDFIKEGDQVSVTLASGQSISAVKITNLTPNGNGTNSIIVPVEGDTGIGTKSSGKWQRLYGPAPSLDDDDSLPQEPDGFQ